MRLIKIEKYFRNFSKLNMHIYVSRIVSQLCDVNLLQLNVMNWKERIKKKK